MSVERVGFTPATAALLDRLREIHGALLFHQSGGCCDGSSPMCYPINEFRIGGSDVLLGIVYGCPFYISGPQFEYWKHTHLTVDVVPGRGSGFSVEAPEGLRFLVRSRLFDEAEGKAIEAEEEPPRGVTPSEALAAAMV